MAGRQPKLTAKRKDLIIELLSKGATDKDACAAAGIDDSTLYRWLQEGKEGKTPEKSEFYESVTRARADARLVAIESVRLGMLPNLTKSETTETIRETRLNRKGQPYSYEKVVSRRTLTDQPGDWRAGIEYLKRRDPEHWTDRVVISFSPEAVAIMQQLGIEPSEAVSQFEELLKELAAMKAQSIE
jgi:transposase-like protein